MTSPGTPAQRRRPAGRYDDPRRLNRRVVVPLAVVAAAAVTAGATALYSRHQASVVPFELRAYAVSAPGEVTISWEVKLGRGERGECQLRARGGNGSDVGSAIVPVGPGTGRTELTSYVLPTTARASTGEVTACRKVASP